MTTTSAKEWADFLVKLGYNTTKKYIVDYIINQNMNDEEVWNYFVEEHSLVKEAANANRFYKVDDVYGYFREVSYIKMRGTYPRRNHGRSFSVPRLKPIRELQEEKEASGLQRGEKHPATVAPVATAEMTGLHLSHADFGEGVVKEVRNNVYIVVDFQNVGTKTLSYPLCMELGVLTFE